MKWVKQSIHYWCPDTKEQKFLGQNVTAVSYTHLDVYKRQPLARTRPVLHFTEYQILPIFCNNINLSYATAIIVL